MYHVQTAPNPLASSPRASGPAPNAPNAPNAAGANPPASPAALAPANPKRVVFGAALALLGFSLFTAIALAAWFKRAPDPWSWKSVLAILCAALGVTTSALVWRAPSRTHVLAGAGVMLLSLVRLGSPLEWSFASFVLIGLTALFLVPLVRAAIVLSKE